MWSKGEHPKFTELREHWNGAVWAARDKLLGLFDVKE